MFRQSRYIITLTEMIETETNAPVAGQTKLSTCILAPVFDTSTRARSTTHTDF